MENVHSRKCIHEGCKKEPTYNYDSEKKALYCATHKLPFMENVHSRKCIHEGCRKIPNYNYDNEKKALYCATHKLPSMENINSRKCIHEGCRKIPNYNYASENKRLYCATHKLPSMENVHSRKCIHEGCRKQPNYNYNNEKKALYCATHKLHSMTNISSIKCINEGCTKKPNYNYEGETKALYCATHKKEGMRDIKHRTCIHDWCLTIVTDKYEGYCLRCYIYTFPDKPVTRNYKTKEKAVVDFVCERFPEHTWITDKKVNDGCSMRRPDILLDLGYQVLIIEIDENAHQDYDCSCENKRIMELSQDVGHRPIIFIRFNPDSYRKSDIKIPSCWEQNMNGICVVKYKEDWEYRLNTLEAQIKYWTSINNSTNKIIETIQLFYDI